MKRTLTLFIFVLFTLLVLEPPLLFMFPLLNVYIPELVLIAVLYFAHNLKDSSEGGVATVFLGYIMDLLSGAPVGTHTFTYVILFFGARFFSTLIYGSSMISGFILGGISSLLSGFFILGLDKWLNVMHSSMPGFLFMLKQAAVTAVIAPFYLHLLWKLDRFVSYEAPQEGIFK